MTRGFPLVSADTGVMSAGLAHISQVYILIFQSFALIDAYVFTHHKWIFKKWDAWDKCSGLVHWEDPEESGGEGGGRRDLDGEYM